MSLDALQRRWKHAYPNGEREPLFVSLPTYCVIIAAVSLVLGVQWYFAFEFRKSYLSLTSVILVTNTIWAACGLLVWEMVQIFPLRRGTLARDLGAFAAACLVLLWAQHLRFWLIGGYGGMRTSLSYLDDVRYFAAHESILYVVIFIVLVFVARGWYAQEQMARLRLRAAEMRQELARAELQGLRSQLQPHFFFNALNTISALLHQQPEQADRMIELLSRLMRRSLEPGEHTSLQREFEAAGEYLQLQQLRFASRLAYELQPGPETLELELPSLILQPLVENCVVHAVESSPETTLVRLECRREAEKLVVTVRNSLHAPSPRAGFGHGLNSVERRLRLLYGEGARFSAAANGSEFVVRLEVPARAAPAENSRTARP